MNTIFFTFSPYKLIIISFLTFYLSSNQYGCAALFWKIILTKIITMVFVQPGSVNNSLTICEHWPLSVRLSKSNFLAHPKCLPKGFAQTKWSKTFFKNTKRTQKKKKQKLKFLHFFVQKPKSCAISEKFPRLYSHTVAPFRNSSWCWSTTVVNYQ